MRAVFAIMALMVTLGYINPAEAKFKVDQTQHTCEELRDMLDQHQSIWVKNRLFPFIWQNIATVDPVCNGSARSHPRRICRWYEGRVTASDGRCNLGMECSCRAPNDDDD